MDKTRTPRHGADTNLAQKRKPSEFGRVDGDWLENGAMNGAMNLS